MFYTPFTKHNESGGEFMHHSLISVSGATSPSGPRTPHSRGF